MSNTGDQPLSTTAPVVPSARTEQSGAPAPSAASTPDMPPPAPPPVDVEALRHPTENSRFALALVAATAIAAIAVFVLISLHRATEILGVIAVIVLAFAALWFSLQLWRVRLLADGVAVSAETLPEVQEVLDTVRERLDYRGRVDVFVVDKVSRVLSPNAAPITLTTFFGVRVIVAEGSALGDLTNERERHQLVFLLATVVGALKAQHTRWSPYLLALETTGLPKLVFLFVYPWYRATTYTGDRIAYACCGDLDVSLEAVYRILVGKDTAPYLRPAGLVQQSLVVRRKVILRLSQLLRRVPHATNRYLDLLSFAATYDAAVFDRFRASLGDGPRDVDEVFARLRRRRPMRFVVPAAVVVAALFMVAGVVAGLRFPDSELAQGINSAASDDSGDITIEPGTIETGAVETGPVETVSPTEEASSEASPPSSEDAVLALLPPDLRDTCQAGTPDEGAGEVVVLNCSASDSGGPATVSYYVYTNAAQMQVAYDSYAADLPVAPCSSGFGQRPWAHGGVAHGSVGCYSSDNGDNTVLWSDEQTAVLAFAYDSDLSLDEVYQWWKGNHATLGS